MRIHLFMLILAANMVGSLQAQDSITVRSEWHKGDSRRYTMVQERLEYAGDTLVRKDTTRHIGMELTVTDSLTDGFEISCRTFNLKLLEQLVDMEDRDMIARLEPFVSLNYHYTTDGSGSFLSLDNADEIDAFVDSLFARVGIDDSTTRIVGETIRQLKGTFGAGLSQFFIPEIQRFHFPYGLTYKTGDTLYYADEIAVPFLDTPVATTGFVWLDHIDRSTNTCVVGLHTVPDAEALSNATKAFFNNIISNASITEAEKTKRLAEMETQLQGRSFLYINTFGEYHMDYEQGWPLSISFQMEVQVDAQHPQVRRNVNSIRYEQVL